MSTRKSDKDIHKQPTSKQIVSGLCNPDSSAKALELSKKLLGAITTAQSELITNADPRNLFDKLLNTLLSVTESEYGFIGEIYHDPDGSPFLKTHAITNIAWNEETLKFYEENASQGLEFRNLKTLFGSVIVTGKSIIANDPANDPRAGGLPKGHPPLNAFLGIPFFSGNEFVGMVGIANRPGGYDNFLVQFLQPFLSTCGTIIQAFRIDGKRIQAEKSLREREVWNQAVFNNVLDALITTNDKGIVRSFNPAAEKIFGYSAQEVVGRNVTMFMPEPYRSEHDNYIADYLRTGKRKVIGIGREVSGKRKDGVTFPAELSLTEMYMPEGRGFVGIIRDITERKRAEKTLGEMLLKLEKSNEDMLAILNQLRMGFVMINGEGIITFISRSCQSLLGKRDTDLIGADWQDANPFDHKDKARLLEMFSKNNNAEDNIHIQLMGPKDEFYQLEIEVHDDPRDPKAKILFIYNISELYELRKQLEEKAHFQNMIGKSEPMKRVFQQINELAKVDSTVLIQGETGTGKELVALALHQLSRRKSGSFIPVNCAGLTDSLIAGHLFGHKKGAFTGAIEDQVGVFESANGGTLFLDEIGDIPISVQVSMLRVLQEREIIRLGETRPKKVDVRLVCATNRNLKAAVENGTFRSDFLYRIRVAIISLPLLRERKGDIPLLINNFLKRCRASIGKKVQGVDNDTINILMNYHWPGNVRELQNCIESAVIRCRGTVLTPHDLPDELLGATSPASEIQPFVSPPKIMSKQKQRILDALSETEGNRSAAARLLGISRATLYRQMEKLNIQFS